MNLILNLSLCGVLILAAVAAGIYRKYLEDHCDHYLHLHGDTHDAGVIDAQSAMCKRIETIDKVKVGLIVAAVAYGVAIAAFATYNAWNTSGAS
jgi:hypothetical protein